MQLSTWFLFPVLACLTPHAGASVSKSDLSTLATDLWYSDTNAATYNVDYKLDLQAKASGSKTSTSKYGKLIPFIKDSILRKPTYAAFVRLLDNYVDQTGIEEDVTREEIQEMNTFLDEILKTNVLQKTYEFLRRKNYVKGTYASDFRKLLQRIWFTLYSREKGLYDTSGFEHVFVGELKKGAITGLHNWIQYYRLEKRGALKYKGYLVSRYPNLMKVQFTINNRWKEASGMFYGTSPEFELAMYTVCFLTRPNAKCEFSIDGGFVRILTYKVHYASASQSIASAFPAV
ncbi:uridylate-specific endoribonuclease C-like [Tubulanus polymorphus]|uniref:uridylate-specific endoribonuclease C-like n=1 Tax=Tubulanus polymorphus TaxID=672921 RepID=UPI003DA3B827